MRIIFLVFALVAASPAIAQKIYPQTDFRVTQEHYYREGNVPKVDVYGVDLRNGREYVVHIWGEGKNAAISLPQSLDSSRRGDFGATVPREIGNAPEVSDRFRQALFEYWQSRLPTQKVTPPYGVDPKTEPGYSTELPGKGTGAKDKVPGPQGTVLQLPGPLVPVPGGGSSYDRARAQQTPYRVGQTLDELNRQMREFRDQQEMQNRMLRDRQRMVDADLAREIAQLGHDNAAIKASLLMQMQSYMERSRAQHPEAPGRRFFEGVSVTMAGREVLHQSLGHHFKSGQYVALAAAVTMLANPWDGDKADPALAPYADKEGVLKGPALKPDVLHFEGRKTVQHRIRQAANNLQAWALNDEHALEYNLHKRIVTEIGTALHSSAILEKFGVQDDAERLLYFAEAGVEFLRGVEQGVQIGVIEFGAGVAELAYTGGEVIVDTALHPSNVAIAFKAIAEVFSDPQELERESRALWSTIQRNAPIIAQSAWNFVVAKTVYGSARDRGQFVGRATFEVATTLVPGNVVRVGRGARVAADAQELAAVVRKVDRVAERVAYWSANKSTKSEFVRAMPNLEQLVNNPVKTLRDYGSSFDGVLVQGPALPGDLLFQLQREGQTAVGSFFLAVRPIDAHAGEMLANIAKHSNHGDKLATYVVKKPISAYAGPIAGGDGHQLLIPKFKDFGFGPEALEEVLEKVDETKLMFRTRNGL